MKTVNDFKVNDLVHTADTLEHHSFTKEARANRREKSVGRVLSIEDGHGHGDFLKVRHLDGVVGCYDPDEIELVRERRAQTLN